MVSPKTLLNGTEMPPGLSTTRAKALTETSPWALRSRALPRSSVGTNHFQLSSTTFSCLSNQIPLRRPTQTAAAECFSLEMDDRRGSYDDVVLEGDDEVALEAEGQSDSGYTEFDHGRSAWEEPRDTHSRDGLVTSERKKPKSFEGNFIHRAAISESSMMSESTTIVRRQSLIPGQSPFAVPRSVAHNITNDRHNSGKLLATSHGPIGEISNNTESLNASLQFKNIHFIPDKSSTPTASVAQPRTLGPPHTGHKGAPKPYFKIFSENPPRSSSSRSACAPTNALSCRSVNTPSARGNASSIPVATTSGQKITSPLCLCGRRAKRQLVSNGGPNHGRGFYCCPVRRSVSGGRVQKGCEFFKWESALIRSCSVGSPAISSCASLCHIKSSRRSCPPQSSIQRKSF